MAELKIFEILERRKRFRIVTVICFALLCLIFGKMMISKPSGTKAVNDTEKTVTLKPVYGRDCEQVNGKMRCYIDAKYEGYNVILDGPAPGIDFSGYFLDGKEGHIDYYDGPNYYYVDIDGNPCEWYGTYEGHKGCDNKRHFKSLTIRSGAILTHEGLTKDHENWRRKIDLTVDNDLVIENGGKIDVSGKGYMGGDGYNSKASTSTMAPSNCLYNWPDSFPPQNVVCLFGYGPTGVSGGSGYGAHDTQVGVGAGGSYTGKGGYEKSLDNKTYFETGAENFKLGAGGGAAYSTGNAPGMSYMLNHGGDGGGRVKLAIGGKLIMRGNSQILAEGKTPEAPYCGKDDCAVGGGGAGGTIIISTGGGVDQTTYYSVNGWHSPIDSNTYSGGNGETLIDVNNGSIQNAAASAFYPLLSAKGGAGVTSYFYSGGGGGGYISITEKGDIAGVAVKKTLEAVCKSGFSVDGTGKCVAGGNNFNPYALSLGDVIKVNLEVRNITSDITITDQLLKSSSPPHTCAYINNYNQTTGRSAGSLAASPLPTGTFSFPSTSDLAWSLSASGSSTQDISYYCVVQ